MPQLIDLHFKPEALKRHGLPDIAYPLPVDNLPSVSASGGELSLAQLIYGLQLRSAEDDSQWQPLEPVLARLAELLATDIADDAITASGERWWLELGPVDLAGDRLVTLQRDMTVLAALTKREDGRLKVAVYRPLDAKSISSLISLAQTPHPEHGVCMRPNNWEYALDCSASNGNFYASQRGEAYLSYWEKGLGVSRDGELISPWREQIEQPLRPIAEVITELSIYDQRATQAEQTIDEPSKSPHPDAPVQSTWPSKRQQKRSVQNRFTGCLLGGAVGDALGAPVEFMTLEDIRRSFGAKGITRYAPAYGGLGTITDDTQMTLFTAEGLLRGWMRGVTKGTTSYPGVVTHAYLRWLATQGETSRYGIQINEDEAGWLYQQRALHNRRAPGNTCLSALRSLSYFEDNVHNDSKGCGGVMRVAPVGLFAWTLRGSSSLEYTFELGADLAGRTHGHPTGQLTAGVFAVLIRALADGASLAAALPVAKGILREHRSADETLRAIELAERLAASDFTSDSAIVQLGQGWIAEEALAISIYCALVARTFRQGVIMAVNHSGDSDSTGSMTGNLLGTLCGVRSIPKTWLDQLELNQVICELAQDLYAFKDWPAGPYSDNKLLSDRLWAKYPGH